MKDWSRLQVNNMFLNIARQVHKLLQPVAKRLQANIKVVEVPPGPPVMSPLVAEIYEPDHNEQMRC
ncbi:MAG TPA: hypothetical protein ENI62_02225 [Gammaproteobacteria bacterium]|nr:hypothetical protein [Gammaproteobacteria bacterium]